MVEIIVGVIAGIFLLLNTYTTQKTKSALKVSNGVPPGFMIEQTHNTLNRLETKVDSHILNSDIHFKEG